jgi:hypothetical protein
MKLKFAKFDLGILSSLGGDVIKYRGLVGNSTIQGNLKKPDMGVCMLKRLASQFKCRLRIK